MSLRKLRIIVWKNLLLRKRQYIITSFEIGLPILAALIMVLISAGRRINKPDEETTSEEELRKECTNWCTVNVSSTDVTQYPFIAYIPETPEVTRVVEQVVDELCRNSSGGKLGLLPVANASELEKISNKSDNFRAAIVFPNDLKTSPADKGATINYEIRMTHFTTNKLLPMETEVSRTCNNPYSGKKDKDDFSRVGPNLNHLKSHNFGYFTKGFLCLQIAVEKMLARFLTGVADFNDTITLRSFPHPEFYAGYGFKHENLQNFIGIYALFMIFMIPSITRNVVGEKQSGMTELLRSAGVSNWIQSIGWLIHAAGPHLITVTIITIFLRYVPQSDHTALLGYSDPSLVWIVHFLAVVHAAAFFYFLCSLFQKPFAATTVVIILWIITGLVTFYQIVTEGALFPSKSELVPCLFPNLAYVLGMRLIVKFDQIVVDDSDHPLGGQWNRLNEACPYRKPEEEPILQNATLLEVMIVQLFSICLYMVLAMYFECILPSQYGVKRPWHISDCKRTNSKKQPPPAIMASNENPNEEVHGTAIDEGGESSKSKASMTSKAQPQSISDTDGATTVMGTSNVPVGIDVQNVAKRFGKKVAVNGVSVQMYSGDIFALLGHNGAGKTTLISMITGWFSPTSGTVMIDGMDIRDDLDRARASMGLCPQQNMLFDHLTVSEHLRIFGMLRGQKMKEAKAETNSLLIRMSFTEKAKTSAKNLSGGQKRKLCLGMALIGGTKVVVLDEPTSGLDPQARREIWDLLLELRGERTILLTTHFMEEADVLADRIGIMAGGALQCVGTAEFLKQFYGKGYSLKITFGKDDEVGKAEPPPDSDNMEPQVQQPLVQQMSREEIKEAVDALLATVKKRIPDAALNNNVRSDPTSPEVILMLPSETATTKALGSMFSDLTANRAKLKIKTMGLSQTSMEDVFLKVGELTEVNQQEEMGTGDGTFVGSPKENEETVKSPKVYSPVLLAFGRFTALMIKRCIHFIRKWGLLIIQILLPFALFMVVVHITTAVATPTGGDSGPNSRKGVLRQESPSSSHSPSIPMTLNSYKNPITAYDYDHTSNDNYLKSVIGPSAKYYRNINPNLREHARKDIKQYKRKHIVALYVDRNRYGLSYSPEVIALYNTYPYHSAPLAINLASNVILKYLDPNASHTIHLTSRQIGGADNPSPESRKTRDVSSTKSNSARYANDLMSYFLPLALLIIVTCFIVVPVEEKICQAKQLQSMSGASPVLYWGSLFTFDYFIIYFLLGILMLIYMLIFDWYRVYTYGAGAVVFLLIVMMYGFTGILFSYLCSLRSGSVGGGFILVMLIHVVTGYGVGLNITEANAGVGMIFLQIIARLFPTYSLTRALIRFGYISVANSDCHLLNDCSKGGNLSYLTWTMDPSLIGESAYSFSDFGSFDRTPATVPGIIQDLVILFFMGVIYAVLLLVCEYKVWRYFSKTNNQFFPISNYPVDDDVRDEVDRVNNLIANRQNNADCLLVQNLSKSYDNFAAVKSVTFGVHHGECFGLLGVNGAGKTTAFRMLTGDESPTAGEAYGFNTWLSGNASQFFSNIGYCPQFDGFIPDFKGHEMLQLFAGLRGVPFSYRKTEAMKWLKKVGLLESANVRCKNYSGGMKRRLTTAMALIGDPALILLDEPTSGVDPVSRRQFWKILDNCRDSGQSVILTSHSMEECEALCSRLAIMVNGEFQCFGGVQHLKNKFAQGYSLILKLKTDNFPPDSDELQEKMNSLQEKISQKFEPCTLKDKHQNLVQYHLENASITWDVLFKALEELKDEFEDFIEDFAVNETSLEEVFLSFARAQYPERRGNGKDSCLKRLFTCRC